jgi:tetratricopeptide (TPR) repeat protein
VSATGPAARGEDCRLPPARWHLPVLLLVAALPYLRVGGFAFVFDDGGYVVTNLRVRNGLTLDGVRWALTAFHAGNWHPLTWLSHMADISLFGLAPGPHHAVNVALHAANAALLFLALRRLTGAAGRAFVVAALFAAHPLRVESVAWVAERKDLLSAFFFFLTLLAYAHYVERRTITRYLLVAALFTLGLLSKPMVVTLPFTLLLLDLWPLARLHQSQDHVGRRGGAEGGPPGGVKPTGVRSDRTPKSAFASFWPLLAEKIPLLALSAATSFLAFLSQRQRGAITVSEYPWDVRLQNALVGCARYLADTLWPRGLAVPYRHLGADIPPWQVAVAATALLGLSAAVAVWGRRRRYLVTGWLWYLGMLVPVIGLIQVGEQSRADRYTYLPTIGFLVIVAWGGGELLARRALPRAAVPGLVAAAVATLMALSWHQTDFWRDDVTLFTRAVAIDPDNVLAQENLGVGLNAQHRYEEALPHFRAAVRLKPHLYEAQSNLGLILCNLGRYDEAIDILQGASRLKPWEGSAYLHLGFAYVGKGDRAAALEQYRKLEGVDPARAAQLRPFLDAPPD